MAEKDVERAEEGAEPSSGKKKKTLLFLILGGLGITSVAGTALFMTGVIGGKHKGDETAQLQEAAAQAKKTPVYYALEKPITVNFETESGLRFLQVEIEVMIYDPLVIDNIKTHMPVIRHELIAILSSQNYSDLISAEGKDKIRIDILNKIKEILQARSGKPGIEEVYFTNFVIQ